MSGQPVSGSRPGGRRPPKLRLLAVGLAGMLVLSACATARPSPGELPTREVAGHFTAGTGVSWFRPCSASAGDTLWWATFLGPAVAARDSLLAAGRIRTGAPTFLRVLAGLSDPGPAGAEGRGSRFIYVHAVREARLPRADDCTTPGASP